MGLPVLLLPLLVNGFAKATEGPALVAYAKDVIRAEVTHSKSPAVPKLGAASPVFVTIERAGKILGCRGVLKARKASLAAEIEFAARSACAHDPRYRPVRETDLDKLLVTVTMVERIEPMDANQISTLLPSQGLVLVSAGRSGVVLPWEGSDPGTRLEWAYRKAGVSRNSSVALSRMFAERWRG